jgi:predicted metal-binding protein
MINQLLVCTGCNNYQAKLPKDDRPLFWGRELTEALQSIPQDNLAITPYKCLGACSSACVITFRCKGKPTIIFGGLRPGDAEDILALGKVYAECDGNIPWSDDRPACLRNQIAKIPK